MDSPVAEEPKGFSSALDEHPNLVVRQVPDVPEDVDFYMDHLNDPNMDLRANRPSSIRSFSMESKKKGHGGYAPSDVDTESQYDRYSTSRAESAIDFDE